jgi:hypothetical protein
LLELTSLDHTIREGNSIISGRAAHHKPRKGARDAKRESVPPINERAVLVIDFEWILLMHVPWFSRPV